MTPGPHNPATERCDSILEILSHPGQNQGARGFDVDDACWRCERKKADPGSTAGVCLECRAILLGDADPLSVKSPQPTRANYTIEFPDPSVGREFHQLSERIQGVLEVCVQALRGLGDRVDAFNATFVTMTKRYRQSHQTEESDD